MNVYYNGRTGRLLSKKRIDSLLIVGALILGVSGIIGGEMLGFHPLLIAWFIGACLSLLVWHARRNDNFLFSKPKNNRV